MKNRLKKIYSSLLLLFFSLPLYSQLYSQSDNSPVELSADKAVEMAMDNNRTIKALEHQLKAAEYDIKSAATNFLPDVSLSGQYARLSKTDGMGTDQFSTLTREELEILSLMQRAIPSTNTPTENSYSIGLEIQQPIFTGFQTLYNLRSTKVSHNLQGATNEKTRQTIKYAVLQIYWGLVKLQKSKIVAQKAKEQLEELTSIQTAMMEQGMTTEHDYLLTKANLTKREIEEMNATKTLKMQNRIFASVLGLPVNSEIILTDSNTAPNEIITNNIDSIINKAQMERPDLKELCLQAQLSELGIKTAKASFSPSLYAGFSYSNSRPDQIRRDQWGDNWTLYASLNFTLWDWGNRFFKIKKAKEQKLSLVEALEQKEANIEVDVKNAYDEVVLSLKKLKAAHLMTDAHDKTYQASLAKYEEGVISMYELLETHTSYTSAQYQVLEAATNLELAIINLEMGGLGNSSSIN